MPIRYTWLILRVNTEKHTDVLRAYTSREAAQTELRKEANAYRNCDWEIEWCGTEQFHARGEFRHCHLFIHAVRLED